MSVLANLRQRSDYTHRYNIHSGRHGWIRLTPAYSVKVVEEILSDYNYNGRVFDPFCGSGTTVLCASRSGLASATTDINPFLVWLAGVKIKHYSPEEITETRYAVEDVLACMDKSDNAVEAPPIHNIQRWWSNDCLSFLCSLKGAINNINISQAAYDILNIAFCRTLIKLSNASFNHQSMSFKDSSQEHGKIFDRSEMFKLNVNYILEACEEDINAQTTILLQDARDLKPDALGFFDLVVTSPPYANRMSYIRELRPYMYWLGYLHEAREAGELDWRAIGGTWGIATSRLNDWSACENYNNDHLASVVSTISQAENKHAETLSRYVHKYCEDIFSHFSSLTKVLNKGARVHYIIGNSTFYGTLVSIEKIYADIMTNTGFSEVDIKPIRKRNSKKELIEFDVSATWK